jgi:hypothetical protein
MLGFAIKQRIHSYSQFITPPGWMQRLLAGAFAEEDYLDGFDQNMHI